MFSTKAASLATALYLLGTICLVSAHGYPDQVVNETGATYSGYNAANPKPPSVGWFNSAKNHEFVGPADYGNGDIICHKNASPGQLYITVAAGSTLKFHWEYFVKSHHGPIMVYMARCDGPCEKVDKYKLRFFKICEEGLIDGKYAPGYWAVDKLFDNNLWHSCQIPAQLAPGNHVIRIEIIGHHESQKKAPQHYPFCFNSEVTGSGTIKPDGIPATQFYDLSDPGIDVDIYGPPLGTYTPPGPRKFDFSSAGDRAVERSRTGLDSPDLESPDLESSATADAANSTSAGKAITRTGPSLYVDTTATPANQTAASTKAEEATSTTCTKTTTTLPTAEAGGAGTKSNQPSSKTLHAIDSDSSSATKYTNATATVTATGLTPSESSVVSSAVVAASSAVVAASSAEPSAAASMLSSAIAAASSADPSVASMFSSAVAAVTSKIPSAVESNATPTATAAGGGSGNALPGGMSLEQFLEELKVLFANIFKDRRNGRKHARDLVI